MKSRKLKAGMTMLDVIVGTAIMLVVFLSIFGSFKIAINLIYSTKAKTGAVALVADRIEYIRGLPYDSVGTAGGIPPGVVPELATSTINGITYTLRTFIVYTDDAADGLGSDDQNSITADYKTVKVEVNWMIRTSARSTFAVTTIAPVGTETLTAGGLLKINVVDALVAPVLGASVRVVNPSTTPAIDVTALSNDLGTVSFPGTPPAGGYQITVSKSGYSSAQTYSSTSQNPNPSPGHVAVTNDLTSTISFAIDRLATLLISAFAPVGSGVFSDTFTDESKLAATTTVHVTGGALVLDSTAGVYAPTGDARSIDVAPALLAAWTSVTATTTTPAGTTLTMHVVYLDGAAYALIPDSALPGNVAGFTANVIDLGTLSTSTYPTIALVASFTSTNGTATASLLDWSVRYDAGPTPLPGVAFTIRGSKTIGTTAASAPIYKYTSSFTSDASGEWFIDPIEWDTYTVVPNGVYDVAERCPNSIVVSPGGDAASGLTLVPDTTNTLKVYVASATAALPGATVELKKGSTTITQTTSACGQTFFGNLTSGAYTLKVSKSGYKNSNQSVSLSGATELSITLSP